MPPATRPACRRHSNLPPPATPAAGCARHHSAPARAPPAAPIARGLPAPSRPGHPIRPSFLRQSAPVRRCLRPPAPSDRFRRVGGVLALVGRRRSEIGLAALGSFQRTGQLSRPLSQPIHDPRRFRLEPLGGVRRGGLEERLDRPVPRSDRTTAAARRLHAHRQATAPDDGGLRRLAAHAPISRGSDGLRTAKSVAWSTTARRSTT